MRTDHVRVLSAPNVRSRGPEHMRTCQEQNTRGDLDSDMLRRMTAFEKKRNPVRYFVFFEISPEVNW